MLFTPAPPLVSFRLRRFGSPCRHVTYPSLPHRYNQFRAVLVSSQARSESVCEQRPSVPSIAPCLATSATQSDSYYGYLPNPNVSAQAALVWRSSMWVIRHQAELLGHLHRRCPPPHWACSGWLGSGPLFWAVGLSPRSLLASARGRDYESWRGPAPGTGALTSSAGFA